MDAYREGREDQHNKKTMDWAQDANTYYYETFEAPLLQRIDELKGIADKYYAENKALRKRFQELNIDLYL